MDLKLTVEQVELLLGELSGETNFDTGWYLSEEANKLYLEIEKQLLAYKDLIQKNFQGK